VTCAAFETWLDDGMPAGEAPGASAHAASCASCARALAAAQSIEAGLAGAVFTAPAGMTDRVMARVAAHEARRPAARRGVPALDQTLPWWVRAATDPAAIGALALAAVLIWKWDVIAGSGALAFAVLAGAAAGTLPAPSVTPFLPGAGILRIAVAMVLVPAGALLALASYRMSEHWVARWTRIRA
jgi:hypothetical protein